MDSMRGFESVKNKMASLIKEKHEANKNAEELHEITKDLNNRCFEYEKQIKTLERDIARDEEQLDLTITKTHEALEKLEEESKVASDGEQNVATLSRRLQLLEEELNRVNTRLKEVYVKLESEESGFEESERQRRLLDAKCNSQEEQLEIKEAQLEEATFLADEADRKFEEMSRKLRMVENDYERIGDRADEFEKKCAEFEEAVNTSNNKLRDLEILSGKNSEKEDNYEAELSKLTDNLNSIGQGPVKRGRGGQKSPVPEKNWNQTRMK